MSELGELEAAIITLLESIEVDEEPAFATVAGHSDSDRKRATAAITRERQPAAFVIYAGRARAEIKDSVVGVPKMTVLISARHLGGEDAPRLGDDGTSGGFELLGEVMQALDGTVLLTDRRLQALDEELVWADERAVVYEQRYLIERVCELSAPTFGGTAIAGTDSIVSVVLGEVEADTIAFAFPGINGVYRHGLGVRGRQIRWEGQLRADSDLTLNTLEEAIEGFVNDPEPRSLVDSWGRGHPECVLDSFRRVGARVRHPVTGQALQNFEVAFMQLKTEN